MATKKKETKTTKETKVTKKKTEIKKVEKVEFKGKLTKNIKPGLTVMIIKGKHKGKSGEIYKVDRQKGMVFLKDINQVIDYQKGSAEKNFKDVGIYFSKIKLVS